MPKVIPVPASPGDPYSEVVEAAGLVFIAGQIGLARDQRAADLAFEDEAHACFTRIADVLERVGLGLDSVVRCTVYLTDFDDFAAMNAVFRDRSHLNPPPGRPSASRGWHASAASRSRRPRSGSPRARCHPVTGRSGTRKERT